MGTYVGFEISRLGIYNYSERQFDGTFVNYTMEVDVMGETKNSYYIRTREIGKGIRHRYIGQEFFCRKEDIVFKSELKKEEMNDGK